MPVVEYEKRDRVAYVNLNRPEAMNALNLEKDRPNPATAGGSDVGEVNGDHGD